METIFLLFITCNCSYSALLNFEKRFQPIKVMAFSMLLNLNFENRLKVMDECTNQYFVHSSVEGQETFLWMHVAVITVVC